MGAGKTTVSQAMARRLGLPLFDSDHETGTRRGVRTPVIFEYESEVGFHDRETYTIDELTVRNGATIATGGGAMSRAEN